MAFPATVSESVGACQSVLPVVISNTGLCPATVNAVTIGGVNGDNYSLAGTPGLPITIAPGEQVGDGTLKAVFRPDEVDRDRLGTLSVSWLSDPIAQYEHQRGSQSVRRRHLDRRAGHSRELAECRFRRSSDYTFSG